MHGGNHWGGSFDTINDSSNATNNAELHNRRSDEDWDRASLQSQRHLLREDLNETQQSWLLSPPEKKKKKYIDFGCVVCSRKAVKWTVWGFVLAFLVIALPTILAKTLPRHKSRAPGPDDYALALNKALMFFNAQKSGRLPKNNGIPWRGNSGLRDGMTENVNLKGGLVGGYYDAGDNTKFHFPMSFAMTMLSWSLIEYPHKYHAINEYNHVRELIKWGTDYLLLTFNSSATKIDQIYAQVGGSLNGTSEPDDHYCWQRPEDMTYPRPVQTITAGPELAGEMAAALAAASIVFRDNITYSKKLAKGAETVYAFARDGGRRNSYSRGDAYIEPYYNSSGYYDEYIWGAAWLYYATGNVSYFSLATNPGFPRHARAFFMTPENLVLSWDNKLPAAMLLLTRIRIFLNPGYPYEEMLQMYHNTTVLTMCSYLPQFRVFNFTRGGMIQLNGGRPQNLQYVANAAFLASLFVDYMNATDVPGFNCGPNFFSLDTLRDFATSQMDYILGKNPAKTSYVVGHGNKFPTHVHHRGASIPNDHRKYSCTGGWRWRDRPNPNPNNITGAMVGGPDRLDRFRDVRTNYNYTEPTLAGNAGLVAALVSLTSTGDHSIDKNSIFSAVPPLYPRNPPPPPPWKP